MQYLHRFLYFHSAVLFRLNLIHSEGKIDIAASIPMRFIRYFFAQIEGGRGESGLLCVDAVPRIFNG